MRLVLPRFLDSPILRYFNREKCACFHCGETMVKEGAITLSFDAAERFLCCYGCLAVLKTIEKNHMVGMYMAAKKNPDSESVQ